MNHSKRSFSFKRFVNNHLDRTLILSVEFTVHPLHKILFSAALVLLACCLPAFAQVTSGTILGSIQDTTGAIIPGAKVTATASDSWHYPDGDLRRQRHLLSQTCQRPPIISL